MKKLISKSSIIIITMICAMNIAHAQKNNKDILLTIKNDKTYKITSDEFLRIYQKNNKQNSKNAKDIEEYLDLFINYKLKVIEAQEQGYDTMYSFIKELNNYKNQLARPYLEPEEDKEKLMKTYYNHLKYEIDISHIMLEMDFRKATPGDTLFAYNKILDIRKRILEGEPFEKVARATSDDPSVKTDGGRKGYIKGFRYPLRFEMAAYKLSPGEISRPVRTKFGYHLIKMHDKRESIGKIKVAHIFKSSHAKTPEAKADSIKKLVFDIHEKLQNGAPFDEMARKYSDHRESAMRGGEFKWFEAGDMIPEFENASVELEEKGEISKPVKSDYGWHIIKLIGKKEVPTYEEIKDDIAKKIEKTQGREYLKQKFIKTKMQEYGYQTDTTNIKPFYAINETTFKKENWHAPSALKTNKHIFSIGDSVYTQNDFAKFLSTKSGKNQFANIPMVTLVDRTYKEFKDYYTMNYEYFMLKEKYPQYRNLINEYKEGILLFNISDDKVWSKAVKDTVGLTKYHEKNKENYMWDQRVKATIYSCSNEDIAQQVEKFAGKKARKGYSDQELIEKALKKAEKNDTVTIEKGLFLKGDNDIIDRVKWKDGLINIINTDDKTIVVHIDKTIPSQPKSLDEARGIITADYQDYLEKEWINSLKEKYSIDINKSVLQKISQQE